MAAQDFRHAVQRDSESVSDFIRRAEHTFRIAYGRDPMSNEIRDTLLYCQLQEGLRHDLIKVPAVSGATKYQELCVAAKNEEKRLAELQRRRQYSKPTQPRQAQLERTRATTTELLRHLTAPNKSGGTNVKKCFFCKKPGHLMQDCRLRKHEHASSSRPAATKQVTIIDSEGVRLVRVADEGSQSQLARVIVQGVPADGAIDTGADITITGQELFARVAAAGRLRKKNFQKPDKVPWTYDRKTFRLDGCMDMDISFADKTMSMTVYIKMDAHDQLLLLEGVCRQVGMCHTTHPTSQGRLRRRPLQWSRRLESTSYSHSGCHRAKVLWFL